LESDDILASNLVFTSLALHPLKLFIQFSIVRESAPVEAASNSTTPQWGVTECSQNSDSTSVEALRAFPHLPGCIPEYIPACPPKLGSVRQGIHHTTQVVRKEATASLK
jgi:hypothetical protein